MFTLDVKADVQPTIAYLNRIKDGLGDQVIASTLNKTIDQTQTQMVRGIASTYNIKQTDIRQKLSKQRASRAGQRFTATLFGNPFGRARRALNVIRFLERVTTLAQARKRGKAGTLAELHFKILKAGGKSTIKGAFVLNVAGTPVFRRTGPGRKEIEPVRTVGVPQMFMAHKVQDPVQRWIPAKFAELFEDRMRYFLRTVR
jgi:hypothetical protein